MGVGSSNSGESLPSLGGVLSKSERAFYHKNEKLSRGELTFPVKLFKCNVMEKTLENSRIRRNIDGLGIVPKMMEYLGKEVERVLHPPEKEITEEANELLDNALTLLEQEEVTSRERRIIQHKIEEVLQQENPVEKLKEKIVINVHFWLQVLRAPDLKNYGTELKFFDPTDLETARQKAEPDQEVAIIIEKRVRNLSALKDKFLDWAKENNIQERLNKGSLILSTNHDSWSTQAISLYFFQKYLDVPVTDCATVLGPRLLAFAKFMFDPEKLTRGHGDIFLTFPPTENGRHKAFDEEILDKSGRKYILGATKFLKQPGKVISICLGATRDKEEDQPDGSTHIVPVTPAKEALESMGFMIQKSGAAVAPIAFNHGEGFKLTNTRQKIDVDINFGDIINPEDIQGDTEEERGRWVHQKMVDIVPQRTP